MHFCNINSAKKLIITVLFAFLQYQKCKKAYNYCAFYYQCYLRCYLMLPLITGNPAYQCYLGLSMLPSMLPLITGNPAYQCYLGLSMLPSMLPDATSDHRKSCISMLTGAIDATFDATWCYLWSREILHINATWGYRCYLRCYLMLPLITGNPAYQ